MPERNHEFGKFGARGAKGSDLVAGRLDFLAGGIATPVTEKRGWTARLRYLTRSTRQKDAARAAGLTVSDRTIKKWQEGKATPSKASLQKLEDAYRSVRRKNVAASLQKRLEKDGRGTRVEFHPLNQSQVPRPLQRPVEYRHMNVRKWGKIVDAWADGNAEELADSWESEVLVDLGSQWGQYEYATSIGFSA